MVPHVSSDNMRTKGLICLKKDLTVLRMKIGLETLSVSDWLGYQSKDFLLREYESLCTDGKSV